MIPYRTQYTQKQPPIYIRFLTVLNGSELLLKVHVLQAVHQRIPALLVANVAVQLLDVFAGEVPGVVRVAHFRGGVVAAAVERHP